LTVLPSRVSDHPIMIRGLVKDYGQVRALDGLDLEVESGEVHGLLGPNGAGKSTTIRILLGLLRSDGGEARLLGGDPWREAVDLHRRLAYVPDDVRLWPNLSGGEVIDLLGRLRGGLDAERRTDLIKRFRFDPRKKCGTYSRGNRQKVALISAFASNVDLYLMDEPTTGLDPLMVAVFRDCVREAQERGCTTMLSSHVFADVEALCDRVTIIRDGHAVESGSLKQLRHLTRTTLIAETARSADDIRKKPGVHGFERLGDEVRFQVDPEYLSHAVRYLSSLGLKHLVSQPPTLEELFMRHYEAEGTVKRTGVKGARRS
jgi:ABC-2 type transport system ATP-binding protein